MNIIKNEKRIKRNGTIGQYILLAAVITLAPSAYILVQSVRDPASLTSTNQPLWLTLTIIGFFLMQISTYMGNKWGRSPRADQQLDSALKGLPGDYTLYHYTTPVQHLLVGPAGVWVFLPYRQSGKIVFQKNRWKVIGGGFLQAYMSIFGQEGIGRPDLEMNSEISTLENLFKKRLEGNEPPIIQGALIFTSNKIEIESNDAPVPAMQIDKLKGFIRQKAKEKSLSALKIREITDIFEKQ